MSQRYQGKAKVIHMNIDAEEVKPFLGKYNVRGTPTIVLLDKRGHVAANVPGWPGDDQVANALDKLVAEP
jgi:thioredoxin-related protein